MSWQEFAYGAAGLNEPQNPSTIRGTFAFFHPTSKVGARTVVYPGAYIGPHVEIGEDCVIGPNACIGQPGFRYEPDGNGGWEYLEHSAGVIVGDRVHIGANTCVDQGRHRPTMIASGCKVDNGCHVAHNVHLLADSLVIANSMIAGSCNVGPYAYIGPAVNITDHINVGARARIGMGSNVLTDVPAGQLWVGSPARYLRDV